MSKKVNVDLDLRKKACDQSFSMKQLASGVFIEGFANKATIDRGDELIATDAWELDNFKRNPIILFNHGMDTLGGTPVGKATDIKPTEDGLFLKVKMSNSQAPGIKMVRELVEERILKAFSVGFNPKETDTLDVDGKAVRKIVKAELFEVSIVGVPMNQDSLFDISEKALTTKSLHELKGEILKHKGAGVALAIEEQLGKSRSRKDAIAMVAKTKGIEIDKLLDMLAGDAEITGDIAEAFSVAVKAVDLKLALEEALASVEEGKEDSEIIQALMEKIKEEEDTDEEEEDTEDTEEDTEEEGKEEGEEEEASGRDGDAEDKEEDSEETDEESRRKADFQDCVNSKVPGLLEEGMEQDEAVAVAISKCQEEGKCVLTPESKTEVFSKVFVALDSGEKTADLAGSVAFKEVSEEDQTEQAPTTPVKTEDSEDNFGSPHLDAAKQTNVLLGALINEFQKINNNLSGLLTQNSVESDSNASMDEQDSEEDESEKYVKEAMDSLNTRLKNLGC